MRVALASLLFLVGCAHHVSFTVVRPAMLDASEAGNTFDVRMRSGRPDAVADIESQLRDRFARSLNPSIRLIGQGGAVLVTGDIVRHDAASEVVAEATSCTRNVSYRDPRTGAMLTRSESYACTNFYRTGSATLEVRFQVTLGDGACVLGGSVFTATIDESSALVTERGAPLAPGFGRFPSAFVPAFSVLLEPRDRYRVELAATTIGAMQQTTHTPLAPALARDSKEAVGPLLAVGTSNLADVLVAPIHSGGFRLRDKDGRVWDEFTPDAPFAAMQGWSAGGRDILLLHHTGDNGLPLQQLLDETLSSYGWFGTRGDVVVRAVNGPARPLTLANAGWRIERLPDSTSSWLARYRTWVLGVSVLIVLGLLWWLYPRVVRRELDPAG